MYVVDDEGNAVPWDGKVTQEVKADVKVTLADDLGPIHEKLDQLASKEPRIDLSGVQDELTGLRFGLGAVNEQIQAVGSDLEAAKRHLAALQAKEPDLSGVTCQMAAIEQRLAILEGKDPDLTSIGEPVRDIAKTLGVVLEEMGELMTAIGEIIVAVDQVGQRVDEFGRPWWKRQRMDE